MNENSTMIFPTTYKQLPLISLGKTYFPKKNLVPVALNSYFNQEKKDVSNLDNRSGLDILCYPESEFNFNSKRLVLTSGTGSSENIKKSIFGIKKALNNRSNIYSCLTAEEELKLADFAKESNLLIDMKKFNSPAKQLVNTFLNNFSFEDTIGQELYRPKIPVIAVGSIIGFSNQSEITAQICLDLKNSRAAAIVNSNDYSIFNCFPMLDEIFHCKYSLVEKVILLNRYIKYVIEVNQCDVLVIEVPGGLIKLNDYYLNDLGQYAYILSHAIDVDYFVCCSPCNHFSYDFYRNIFNYILKKFNFETVGLHISNCFLDLQFTSNSQQVKMVFKPFDTVYNQIEKLLSEKDASSDHIGIYNLLERNSFLAFLESL
mgnify:CR=1 FL=1